MGKNSYREVLARASSFLEQNQLEGHMIEYVFLQRKHWNKTDYLLHMHEPITAEDQKQIGLAHRFVILQFDQLALMLHPYHA